MVAVSPLLWDYSQEVRAYIAVPLLAILLLYGADRLLHHHPRQRDWALVFLTELVALYTHNLAVPLVIWLNVTLILFWLFRRDGRHLTLWIVSQVALGLLYLPWVLSQTPSGTPLNTPPTVGLGLLRDIWYSYFLPVPLQLHDTGSSLRPRPARPSAAGRVSCPVTQNPADDTPNHQSPPTCFFFSFIPHPSSLIPPSLPHPACPDLYHHPHPRRPHRLPPALFYRRPPRHPHSAGGRGSSVTNLVC